MWREDGPIVSREAVPSCTTDGAGPTAGLAVVRSCGPALPARSYPVNAGVTDVPAVVVCVPVLPTTVVVVVGAAVVVVVVVGSSPMAAR